MEINTDIVIVGTGVAGLFTALKLPRDKKILMLTKSDVESSDSFLAQGGISVLKDDKDYQCYLEDTMRAGHYENRRETVEIMLKNSREVIKTLVDCGVEFEKKGQDFVYTREGAHSIPRILYHKDITGKEITKKLISCVKSLKNVRILEYTEMTDILEEGGSCAGIVARSEQDKEIRIHAAYTVLATGGIGGTYSHSTNFAHLTGDAIEVAKNHGIRLEHLDYVQIHPTTLYSKKSGRRFLISESVRGEGAVLYNKNKQRFVDELQPRDVVTKAIHSQMEKDKSDYVWLSMEHIDKKTIMGHFPNIYERCLLEGYDVTKECIPVVPAQHYFMGGIWVDSNSKTSMDRLFAVGETSCNGVHGANRLASNSLLESMVFAGCAAKNIAALYKKNMMKKENGTDEYNINDIAG